MREVQINRNLILREDGKLFNVHTGEEYVPKSLAGSGYYQVSINSHKYRVHQLVMKFFGPPKPDDNYIIDHIDRNKLNNNINNLRWVTIRENCNNTDKNRQIGKRLVDFNNEKDYYYLKTKEYRANNREKMNECSRNWHKKHYAEYKDEYLRRRRERYKQKKEGL